jgi:hypothetical protein
VVLSACESGKGASDSLNNGLSRRLALLGIPHVIGMRESVLDRSGIGFARTLCDTLARKEPLDLAVQCARQAIATPLQECEDLLENTDVNAELSLGQWCLPMLISKDASLPLVDWEFTPRPEDGTVCHQSLQSVILPDRFRGRRMELRRLEGGLASGRLKRLLVTGPGGQGKTALAGKLMQYCESLGQRVFAWSAVSPEGWEGFVLDLELELSEQNIARYDRIKASSIDEPGKIRRLLEMLLNQFPGGITLLFDNLESLQDPDTLELTEPRVGAWIRTARDLNNKKLVLLATSRWRLPGWPEQEHRPLEHASYGDFLQMARDQKLPRAFMARRDSLRQVWKTLHGNGRALQFFAAAALGMNVREEETFLQSLARAEAEIQTNMAIERIVAHLSDKERQLLCSLPAYQTPIPLEGIIKLGLQLTQDPEELLQRLLKVSLVEQSYQNEWKCREYQCSPLVASWLQSQNLLSLEHGLMRRAAEYQLYLYRQER